MKKKVSRWKNFERNLPLFQSSETINHGVEKKSQMLVLSNLGLGLGKEAKSLKKKKLRVKSCTRFLSQVFFFHTREEI